MVMTVVVIMMMMLVAIVRVPTHFRALGPSGSRIAVIGQEPENQQKEASAGEEMAFIGEVSEVENIGHRGQRQAHKKFQKAMHLHRQNLDNSVPEFRCQDHQEVDQA